VFERSLGPSGPHRLLVSKTQLCPERQCACRDVALTAVGLEVATDFAHLGLTSQQLGALLEGPEAMHAFLDLDLGVVEPDEHRSPLSSDWVDYMQSEVDGELLDQLHQRWLHAKGWRPREPHEADWPAHEPGELVGWREIHPDDRRDLFLDQDTVFLASEFYCANPDCDCAEATIDFAEILDKRSARSIGYVRVRLPGAEVIELTGQKERLDRLWSAFRSRHKSPGDRLVARKQRLAEIARLRTSSRRAHPPHSTQRVGRNDPCPCGSGHKYKRCCAS
jgi:hypothetical protein